MRKVVIGEGTILRYAKPIPGLPFLQMSLACFCLDTLLVRPFSTNNLNGVLQSNSEYKSEVEPYTVRNSFMLFALHLYEGWVVCVSNQFMGDEGQCPSVVVGSRATDQFPGLVYPCHEAEVVQSQSVCVVALGIWCCRR